MKLFIIQLTLIFSTIYSFSIQADEVLFDKTTQNVKTQVNAKPRLKESFQLLNNTDKLNYQLNTTQLLPSAEKIDAILSEPIHDPYNIELYYVAHENIEPIENYQHNNLLSFMGSHWDNGMLVSTPFTEFSRVVSQKSLNPKSPPLAFSNFTIKEPCSKGIPYDVKLNVSDIADKGFNIEGSYKSIVCSKMSLAYQPNFVINKNTETFIAKSEYSQKDNANWVKIELSNHDYLVIKINKAY